MKRGEHVLWNHGRRPKQVTVRRDHSLDDPPFAAVTIEYMDREHIVKPDELTTQAELDRIEAEKKQAVIDGLSDITGAFNAGHKTVMAIAEHLNKQLCHVLSRALKAERMGLIKLERKA